MYKTVFDTIDKYSMFSDCTGAVLAVSGGPDSMAMLNFFIENRSVFGFETAVAHINHMLREESGDEELMVSEYCKKHNVRFFSLKADIKNLKEMGESVETCSRNIRYGFFEKVREITGFSHTVTAHNSDDNAETLLLNIIRGCGLKGLSAIPFVRDTNIVRPFLEVSKKELEEYCRSRGVPFCTDRTNSECIYIRNIIRNIIIPEINKINPSFCHSASRLISSVSADSEYLSAAADECVKDIYIGEIKIFVPKKNQTDYEFVSVGENCFAASSIKES